MTYRIAILPGDGVGTEILAEADKLLSALQSRFGLEIETEWADIGGAAVRASGDPLPAATLQLAREADAVLLGAVGGPDWDHEPRDRRPETGLLRIRSELELFANLRPAMLNPALADASTLKPDVVAGLDIMIVRELTGGIYFGEPRGIETNDEGVRRGFNTLVYDEREGVPSQSAYDMHVYLKRLGPGAPFDSVEEWEALAGRTLNRPAAVGAEDIRRFAWLSAS